MADEPYPVMVQGNDRQRVGRTVPYYRDLLERGYVEDSSAPPALAAPHEPPAVPPEDDTTEEEVD